MQGQHTLDVMFRLMERWGGEAKKTGEAGSERGYREPQDLSVGHPCPQQQRATGTAIALPMVAATATANATDHGVLRCRPCPLRPGALGHSRACFCADDDELAYSPSNMSRNIAQLYRSLPAAPRPVSVGPWHKPVLTGMRCLTRQPTTAHGREMTR